MSIQIYGKEEDRQFVKRCLSRTANNFDYVIETGRNVEESDRQIRELTEAGTSPDRILGFFRIFREQKVDAVMKHYREQPDGLILGLSYSAYGINPHLLPGVWLNLSVGSEDLYYHLCVLKKIIRVYPKSLTRLRNIIIDMYDDTCFHYDVSLSGAAVAYWGRRGFFEDKHHFDENSLFPKDAEDEMRANNKFTPELSEDMLRLRKLLFDEDYVMDHLHEAEASIAPSMLGYDDYPFPEQFSGTLKPKTGYEDEICYRSRIFHPKTRVENLEIVSELIHTVKSINPRIKITFLHLPVWKGWQEIYRSYFAKRTEEFHCDISRFTLDENIRYLNLRELSPFNGVLGYYWDTEHMNSKGARVFTSILAKYFFDQ